MTQEEIKTEYLRLHDAILSMPQNSCGGLYTLLKELRKECKHPNVDRFGHIDPQFIRCLDCGLFL